MYFKFMHFFICIQKFNFKGFGLDRLLQVASIICPETFAFHKITGCDFKKALGSLCFKFIWEMRRCIGWKSISNNHFAGIWSDFQGSADSQILIQLGMYLFIVELKLEAFAEFKAF